MNVTRRTVLIGMAGATVAPLISPLSATAATGISPDKIVVRGHYECTDGRVYRVVVIRDDRSQVGIWTADEVPSRKVGIHRTEDFAASVCRRVA